MSSAKGDPVARGIFLETEAAGKTGIAAVL
jgi:hypothetical protein